VNVPFQWTVTNTNRNPTFDQDLGPQSNAEGALISLDGGATDLDNDALTYAASGLPAGLTIDTATGLISGTIALGAAASSPYTVNVTVRDGTTVDATDTFTWTVTAVPGPTGPITFRAASTGSNTTATTLVLPKPAAVVAGDAMLATVGARGNPVITPPAGWTLVRLDLTGGTIRQAIYVRIAGASEPASYSFGLSVAQSAAGGIVAYSGVDPANPVDVHGGQLNTSSTAVVAPSVTTTGANRLLVTLGAIAINTTFTAPAGMTERFDHQTPAANQYKVTVTAADATVAATGATGTRTLTAANAQQSAGQTVALRPGAAGPPVDTTPPTVTARTPGIGATGVAVGTNVTATFSEAVTGVSAGTFTLEGPGTTAVAANVTYSAGTLTATLDPNANLVAGVTYTARLLTGITDTATSPNALAPVSWTFTTAAPPDTTPPTVTARTPAINATGVAVGSNVTATFSEAVTGVSGTTFTLEGPGTTPVAAAVTYAAGTATLDPSASLAADTTYTARLTSGITDTATPTPNALVALSWSFTTAAAPPTGGPITFRGASSGSNTTATTLVLPRPAGVVAGDAMLAAVGARGNPVITPPTGWTLVRLDNSGGTIRQALYVHLAGASEPASYTWTLSVAASAAGGIVAYAGVDPASPVDVHGGQVNTSSTQATAPTVTTTGANRLLVALYAIPNLTTFSPPAGMTERYDAQTPAANQYKVTVAAHDQLLAAAGPTGTRVATAANAAVTVGHTVALRPDAGG
jgi:hypothetical protein